jgi:nucleotide-binding universal stress UspA family protein
VAQTRRRKKPSSTNNNTRSPDGRSLGALSTAASVADQESTDTQGYQRILLASEGRPIPDSAIARVTELAAPSGASVHVFSIARVHGVSFGFPNPGLLPTKKEWSDQRDIVAKAINRLKRQGLDADGHVVGTRNSAKRICREAASKDCEVIVMAADPDRNRIVSDLLWSQEPQRVRRKSKLPVYLVVDEAVART